MGGSKDEEDRLLSVVLTGKTRGNRHTLKTSTFNVRQEHNFCHVCGQTLEQVAQRSYGVSLWGDIQNLTGRGHWATCLSWPCLSRGRSSWVPQRVHSNVNYYVSAVYIIVQFQERSSFVENCFRAGLLCSWNLKYRVSIKQYIKQHCLHHVNYLTYLAQSFCRMKNIFQNQVTFRSRIFLHLPLWTWSLKHIYINV